LSLTRTGIGTAFDSLYKDDASFVQHAMDGPLATMLAVRHPSPPASGYLSIIQRIGAWIAVQFPLEYAAAIMASLAAVGVAVAALGVFHTTRPYFQSRALRLALATSLVLVPIAGEEGPNFLASLGWYLIGAAPWIAMWSPRQRIGLAAQSSFLVVTA